MKISRERLESLSNPDHVGPIMGDEIQEMSRALLAVMDSNYDITAQQLRDEVHYNPETGVFTRRLSGETIGHVDGAGYVCFRCIGKIRLAHRMAYFYMTGRLPETVDHIDQNKANNEWRNLREATNAENQWNKGMTKRNTSGVKGVYWNGKLKRWVAEIRHNNEKHYVGSFVDLEAATSAIAKKRKDLQGAFFVESGQVYRPA